MSAPIAITAVQTAAVTAIANASYFSGIDVLQDDGRQQEKENAALIGVGKVVVVLPLLDGDLVGMGASAATHRVGLAVRYSVNPSLVDTDPMALWVKGTAALLAYSSAEKRNAFSIASRSFVLEEDDQGNRGVIGYYEKLAVQTYAD